MTPPSSGCATSLLPLVHLRRLLKLDDTAASSRASEDGFIVVTQVGSQTFGIVVDGVIHTEEIVVKPMSSRLRHIPLFSGNTILGDGSVIMIIDPNGIVSAVGSIGAAQQEIAATAPSAARADGKADLAAGLPCRRQRAEGGAAVARDTPRGDRGGQDRDRPTAVT